MGGGLGGKEARLGVPRMAGVAAEQPKKRGKKWKLRDRRLKTYDVKIVDSCNIGLSDDEYQRVPINDRFIGIL